MGRLEVESVHARLERDVEFYGVPAVVQAGLGHLPGVHANREIPFAGTRKHEAQPGRDRIRERIVVRERGVLKCPARFARARMMPAAAEGGSPGQRPFRFWSRLQQDGDLLAVRAEDAVGPPDGREVRQQPLAAVGKRCPMKVDGGEPVAFEARHHFGRSVVGEIALPVAATPPPQRAVAEAERAGREIGPEIGVVLQLMRRGGLGKLQHGQLEHHRARRQLGFQQLPEGAVGGDPLRDVRLPLPPSAAWQLISQAQCGHDRREPDRQPARPAGRPAAQLRGEKQQRDGGDEDAEPGGGAKHHQPREERENVRHAAERRKRHDPSRRECPRRRPLPADQAPKADHSQPAEADDAGEAEVGHGRLAAAELGPAQVAVAEFREQLPAMSGRREQQLQRLHGVEFGAGVVADQRRNCGGVAAISPEMRFKEREAQQGGRERQPARDEIGPPPVAEPLGDQRPAHELEKKKKDVGIAGADRGGGADAENPGASSGLQAPAARDESACDQSERHRPRKNQKQVGDAALKRLQGEGEQQRGGERPFPAGAQPARAAVERECGGEVGEQERDIGGREDTDDAGQMADRPEQHDVGGRIRVPVGAVRRAQSADDLRSQRRRIALRRRGYPGIDLQRVTTVDRRDRPARRRPAIVVGAPDERGDKQEQADAPMRSKGEGRLSQQTSHGAGSGWSDRAEKGDGRTRNSTVRS